MKNRKNRKIMKSQTTYNRRLIYYIPKYMHSFFFICISWYEDTKKKMCHKMVVIIL